MKRSKRKGMKNTDGMIADTKNEVSTKNPGGNDARREFLEKAGTICAGCVLAGIPAISGVVVMLDPLRLAPKDAAFIDVTTLDSLPADGTPRKFIIKADKQDAWSRFPDRVIGAVYLRRIPDGVPQHSMTPTLQNSMTVQAFNVVCPHLGCAIEYRDLEKDYFCPCHDSAFALADGAQQPGSPSARPLDSLEIKVQDGKVWVKFQNFHTGIAEKKAV
jgi:menaquinol-cytochrome c reductase iron-sulfur subunit